MYKILLLGNGGREHALAWKMAQSPLCEKLFIAQGNAGTAQIGININIPIKHFEQIRQFCVQNHINLIVVGSEEPLVKGIKDYFEAQAALKDIPIIGPNRTGAKIEGSKDWSKQFMLKYGIPTARARTFTKENFEEGIQYLQNHTLPIVLKADGLAAGKGVVIAPTITQAEQTLKNMLLNNTFGEAGQKVLIEQFLQGIELSVFILTDGENYVLLPEAKDYKRIGEGDTGPNTGGMGAVSPVPFADTTFMQKVKNQIIEPTLQGLKKEGIVYQGFIFFGLMNVQGNPYVIEYNCRLGDPEAEVILPRLQTDLIALFEATLQKKLANFKLQINPDFTTTIMLVSQGYPEKYEKGFPITLPQNLPQEVIIFHAGTTRSTENQKLITNGGRVLAVTASASSLQNALQKSLHVACNIHFEGKYYRKDIGKDLIIDLA
ncbi:MAG: phosphoribosylamine--glycine ligase [Microscillaceae bacterium]|nr:phosphoribosylamine--glycine ligase [Microscillaceae bacterium]MDW8460207.1 phosphoribosylamine--glycine ligase [Cytophagales bacterium]